MWCGAVFVFPTRSFFDCYSDLIPFFHLVFRSEQFLICNLQSSMFLLFTSMGRDFPQPRFVRVSVSPLVTVLMTLVRSSGRAAAPGLKPLRLPRAPNWEGGENAGCGGRARGYNRFMQIVWVRVFLILEGTKLSHPF